MKYLIHICTLFALISLWSCNNDVTKRYENKPRAMARMNEIVVISDEELWDSPVKDTFEFYFQSAFPIMPAPEPMFDIRHFTPKLLEGEPLRKELRTYLLIADLSDTESVTTKMIRKDLGEERYLKAKNQQNFHISIGKDKWAREQILIYVFANNEDDLEKAIRQNYPSIANRIRLHDINQLDASIYVLKNENPGLIDSLENKFGFRMRIPGDFENIMPGAENIMYLKRQNNDGIMNMVIQKFAYDNESQMSTENIIALRNEYGKKYVASEVPGSYMLTNTEDLPTYTYNYEIDDMYTMEVRGIWELENDFKGGPYISYLILNKDKSALYFIDAFVLAPGKPKRDMMMQLDYIVKTITEKS